MKSIIYNILIAAFSLVSTQFTTEVGLNNGIDNSSNFQQINNINSEQKVNTYSDPDFAPVKNEIAKPVIVLNNDLLNQNIDKEIAPVEEENITPAGIYVPNELIETNISKSMETPVIETTVQPEKITIPDNLIESQIQNHEEKEVEQDEISLDEIYVPDSLLDFEYNKEEDTIVE